MAGFVIMGEEGEITLPPATLAGMGRPTGTCLTIIVTELGLEPEPSSNGSTDDEHRMKFPLRS